MGIVVWLLAIGDQGVVGGPGDYCCPGRSICGAPWKERKGGVCVFGQSFWASLPLPKHFFLEIHNLYLVLKAAAPPEWRANSVCLHIGLKRSPQPPARSIWSRRSLQLATALTSKAICGQTSAPIPRLCAKTCGRRGYIGTEEALHNRSSRRCCQVRPASSLG